ncbi:MAG TPA: hypothetical protein VMF89_06435, partial [Polyangiales bacterium]|nr:hypothetical protein [Polyangiales bacterium]
MGCGARGSSNPAMLDAGAVKAAPPVAGSGEAGAGGSTPVTGGRSAAAFATSAGNVALPVATAGAAAAGQGGSSAQDAGSAQVAGAGGATTATSGDAATAMDSDPEISGAIARLDAMRVESSIETLAAFTTRNTCSDNTSSGNAIGAARDWIQAQFQAVPQLTVSLQD